MDPRKHEKIKLVEINSYLTCYLCKGYLIDATTISECLHSFCRSCIIKFLQENCYCPVCEVIINKAKPCLKLDKTLQDIVYKLVPELFTKEMYRRKAFYQSRRELAAKVPPEARGEDTERTIFNPQDAISLSIEYISDDSTPGAIPDLTVPKTLKNGTTTEEPHDNPMKRYLQCPGMCRIEVLKKFVRNKYNVDTTRFHIDVLYKRVPLPDHYTLIDIAYIYSWKRNAPMKFFFRITDINKVTERFDYFDGRLSPEIIPKAPRIRSTAERTPKNERKRDVASHNKDVKAEVRREARTSIEVPVKDVAKPEKCAKPSVKQEKNVKNIVKVEKVAKTEPNSAESVEKSKVAGGVVKVENPEDLSEGEKEAKKEARLKPETNNSDKNEVKSCVPKLEPSELILKPEITEEIKSKIQSGSDIKNSVYTNITLNRDDNVEIITKIQKVSNKEGQPIGLNIINHTVKKTNKVQNNENRPKLVPNVDKQDVSLKTEDKKQKELEELEKSNFFKSIELRAKNSLEPPKQTNKPKPSPSLPPPISSAQKRKNCSPMKNEKKPKIEKKPMKIVIQPKGIQNPTVRQMVTNINQNANNMSKIVEQSTTTSKPTDLLSLIDNCKIPASLSITLNEGCDTGARTPPSIPPVKNYIEILKLPDNNKPQSGDTKSEKISSNNLSSIRDVQTFQKIFEQSIVKKPLDTPSNNNNDKTKVEGTKPTPLDLTSPDSAPKRKILEIASQLKRNKIEQEKKKEAKIAIPRLTTQRALKSPTAKFEYPQTSASLHSSSLGINYTVSVEQDKCKEAGKSPKGSSGSKAKTVTTNGQKGLSSSQLLEKYNIQNLAQLTAGLNFGGGGFSPGQYTALHHAMLMKQLEHQNWLNHGPLLQYEKYLQTLSATQSKLMGNIKEN